jgi:hypothetical protein
MVGEEKHWKVGNSNMTLSHKKDGKLWLSYLQCIGEIQMKNLLIIVFWRTDNKKIKKKWNVHKTISITLFKFVAFRRCISLLDFVAFRHRILLFACATFGHHITLWTFTSFGDYSCGRPHSKFLKLEERKRWQWYKFKNEMKKLGVMNEKE